MAKKYVFPKGFLWGAATSSHQVEGGCRNNWSAWEKSKRRLLFLEKEGEIEKHGQENFISGRACDHYHHFKEDFQLAKDFGHNATRFSIEWSRIEPEEGKFDEQELGHYAEVLKTLKELKLEPFVTIFHWGIPLWLEKKGGLKAKNFSKYFSRYAEKLVKEYKNLAKFWITLNEPEVITSLSYLLGKWPPQKKNIFTAIKVYKNLMKSHILAYKKIKSISSGLQVGIAKNNVYLEAYQGRLINQILKKIMDKILNFWFLNNIKNHQDFIGLNHYFHSRVNFGFNKNANKKVSDMGWELYPASIYYSLIELKKYHRPIYITENGLADAKDLHRPWFIKEYLKQVHRAIKEGVDVRGYFHWSLLDNFEWAEGFWPRFGLFEVDYQTLKRTPRPSAFLYKKIAEENTVTD